MTPAHPASDPVHAGLIALHLDGRWRGVLIEGPSGAGKSDLALRALALGFRLVADDRVILFSAQGRPFGCAPLPLRGLIETRGVGVVPQPYLRCAEVALIVSCVEQPDAAPRLLQGPGRRMLETVVPVLELWPHAASAPMKLRLALEHLGHLSQEAYQITNG